MHVKNALCMMVSHGISTFIHPYAYIVIYIYIHIHSKSQERDGTVEFSHNEGTSGNVASHG